ncbi:MAG: cob(I)yrinic acid a,c-diamide adenosyltransferase [Flavobacteriales bacterium]
MSKYKLYTKTGDDGTTGLFSGKRVSKHHVRIKAYGTVDELNAWIGLIRNDEIAAETNSFLIKIQNELMVIASQLADDTSGKTSKLSGKIVPITFENVTEIESEIDKINNELPELKNFIIPGGHVLISYTHLARCTCRRAERFITELKGEEEVSSVIIAYINRLSDYLFILARKLSKDFDVEEIKWIAKKNK